MQRVSLLYYHPLAPAVEVMPLKPTLGCSWCLLLLPPLLLSQLLVLQLLVSPCYLLALAVEVMHLSSWEPTLGYSLCLHGCHLHRCPLATAGTPQTHVHLAVQGRTPQWLQAMALVLLQHQPRLAAAPDCLLALAWPATHNTEHMCDGDAT